MSAARLAAWRRENGAELSESLAELASELRLERVLETIARHVQSTLAGRDYALLLADGDAGTTSLEPGAALALERWLEDAGSSYEPLVVDDLRQVPALTGVRPRGSLCAAPLRFRGKALGALVGIAPEPGAFAIADVDLLQSYATQAAIALTNARLFEAQQALARRDPLTGLLNHRAFHEAVSAELERCRRAGGVTSVALFDLDGFKQVNDTAGHAAGDALLDAVARILDDSCRGSDRAFRVGGDELALVLPGAATAEAATVAARVADGIAVAADPVTASWGVASWPEHGPGKVALLDRADAALYEMKALRTGRRGEAAPIGRPSPPTDVHRRRLALASRLSARLAPLAEPHEIAAVTVRELHHTFDYYLAVIQRLDADDVLRVVAAAGPLAERERGFIAREQPIADGVNGRVARTGEPALLPDTRLDPDYLRRSAVDDPLSELALPIRVAGRVWGVLNLEQLAVGAFDDDDLLLADTIAAQVGAALHRASLAGELERAFMTTLGALSDALESKDSYTAEHAEEVAELSDRVGRRLGLSGGDLRALRYAALLHDIGKVGVRTEVLTKRDTLTAEEYEEIKAHTVIGEGILKRIPFFAEVHPLVRSAHERWDGGGYPDGLAGDGIPLGARIISACDAFHAMTSDRPYRAALDRATAIRELRTNAGTQFDPVVAAALVAEVS